MSKHPKTRNRTRPHIGGAGTSRPDTPELEGGTPLPEELTGRASGSEEDLRALFAGDTAEHFAMASGAEATTIRRRTSRGMTVGSRMTRRRRRRSSG